MIISTQLKKNSYLMTDFQRDVFLTFIEFFRTHMENNNGSYLATLNLDDMEFRWSLDYLLKEEGLIMGSWTPLFNNCIFMKGCFYNQQIKQEFLKSKFYKNIQSIQDNNLTKSNWITYQLEQQYNDKKTYDFNGVQIQNLIQDKDKFNEINYILSLGNQSPISTMLHELYHKYQFSATPLNPIFYIFNLFISLFMGYNSASTQKWTVQGNVRQIVQTSNNEQIINNLELSMNYIKNTIPMMLNNQTKSDYWMNRISIKEDISKFRVQFELILKLLNKHNILNQQYYVYLKNNIL